MGCHVLDDGDTEEVSKGELVYGTLNDDGKTAKLMR